MRRSHRVGVLVSLTGLLLCACATQEPREVAPSDAKVVATVRHTAGPQPAAEWIERANLPAGAQRSDGDRALLLELIVRDGQLASVEPAPLELANLIVRVDARDTKQTVISVENNAAVAIAFDLFVSPDGERFRRIRSCPVIAHGNAFERWPERAAWIAVASVRVADASAADGD